MKQRASAVAVVSLVIAAGAPALARTPKRLPPPPPPPPVVDVGAELTAAIRAKSASRVAKLLGESVSNYGIYFADAACAKQFGEPSVVTGKDVQAFARCLSQLKLQATTRQPGAKNEVVLTYEPGIELELVHANNRVQWLGFQQQTEDDRGRPTLTAQAFEALRKAGKTNLDDIVGGKLEAVIERAQVESVSAWMKICLDDEGSLDEVSLRHTDAPEKLAQKVGTAFEVALRSWRFRPYALRGKATPVCTMSRLTYPAAGAPLVEVLPPASQPTFALAGMDLVQPVTSERDDEDEVIDADADAPTPPGPQNVPPTLLEGSRIRGDKNIVPDDATKAAIQQSGKSKLVTSFKLCLDERGAVKEVRMLKTSGFSAYDAKIEAEMKQWAYKPYEVNGKAAPVCTAVTFIYSQS